MFLGLDVGTGSSKAVLTDIDGRVIDTASITHEIAFPRPGWAEFEAEAVGWSEIASLCAALFSRQDAGSVVGVCERYGTVPHSDG